MTIAPKTRHSLILRLRDREDADSWREFADIYEPVIYRVAIRRGMQHADALELVQRVLLAVARAVDRFQPDSKRAKFRTWLYKITHNEFCKEWAASKKLAASGDSGVRAAMQLLPAPQEDDFSIEYERAVFRHAAEIVRPRVKPSTWKAFWRTSIDGVSPEEVAKETGMTVGAIYIARSRVMARLQKQAASYQAATNKEQS